MAVKNNSTNYFMVISVVALLTLCILGAFAVQLSNIKKNDATAFYGIDFVAYYTGAKLILAGEEEEIYAELKDDFSVVNSGKFFETAQKSGFPVTTTRYVYLPLFLLPFTLFADLGFYDAAAVWLIINLACMIAIIFLEWYFTRDLAYPVLRIMLIASLNLCFFPLFYALKLGQTSIIVYLIICLIFFFSLKKQDIPAGFFLGIIIALKYSPLLFVLYFLYRKRYALVISSLATVIAVFVVSVMTYGFALHQTYWHYLSKLSNIGITGWSNQSLEAFLLRLFTKSNFLHFYPIKITSLLMSLRYAAVLMMIGIVFLNLKREIKFNHKQVYSLEFAAVVLTLLIIPSVSWVHYFMLAALSIILIVNSYLQIHPYRAWIILPLIVIGSGMISFHISPFALSYFLGQGPITKVLVSLPFLGTCMLLYVNLALINKSKSLDSRYK